MKRSKRNTPCQFCDGRKQSYSERCNKCAAAHRVSTGMCHTRLTHGHAGDRKVTPEYAAWHAMKQRCHNPRNPYYKNYGARGITVAKEWRDDFVTFISNVGLRPSPEHTIDRIDNNGNYVPGNVRWATKMEQQLNRRVCLHLRRVHLDGTEEPISLNQVAGFLGLTYSTLRTKFVAAGVLPPERWKERRRLKRAS